MKIVGVATIVCLAHYAHTAEHERRQDGFLSQSAADHAESAFESKAADFASKFSHGISGGKSLLNEAAEKIDRKHMRRHHQHH